MCDADRSQRRPHAVLDLPSRHAKARKIERLLQLQNCPGSIRILEIGCGSGGISQSLAALGEGRYEVVAVDVTDNRLVHDGYQFVQVSGTELPFPDGSFDVVISNHVVEHVGDYDQQRDHLCELARVLSPDGVAYLAVPNRWMLVEPHYRLPFLSWLPRGLRTPYLRLFQRDATFYDCEPLTLGECEWLLKESGLCAKNVCPEAARLTLEIEGPRTALATLLRRVPENLLRFLNPICPTLIYIARRSPQ